MNTSTKYCPAVEHPREERLTHPVRLIHVGLIIFTAFALGLCLWLFLDISTSLQHMQSLLADSKLNPDFADRFRANYREEMWLNLLLAIAVLVLGVAVFGFVSFYLQTVKRLKEVQSIDNYILQSITRGVLTVDREGFVTSCNTAMGEILGIDPSDCCGKPVQDIFPNDDPILEMFQRAIGRRSKRQDEEEEISYTRPNGETLPLRVTTFALRDDKKRLIGSILLVKNLAPIRFLEERLRRQDRLAALGHLTRRVLHEIRNPLSAMDLNLQLLQEYLEKRFQGNLDGKARQYFDIVFSEIYRLDMILQNTHLSVHNLGFEGRKLDLHDVIGDVIRKMEAEIRYSGHELEVNLAPGPAPVLGDKKLLIQVFMNLFRNALEAMGERKGKVSIRSQLSEKGQIIIAVEDTGTGIDWQNIPRIFDPYFTTKKKGTGLGLSIVYNIIDQHGGNIHVGSWLGEGTLFELTFPLLNASEGAEQSDGSSPNPYC